MSKKQQYTCTNRTSTPPVWRVRRKDDPDLWLRSFLSEGEARDFARQHAIAHACDMLIERPPQAAIDDWFDGF